MLDLQLKLKLKLGILKYSILQGQNLTSHVLQSSKRQLIGKSQWCCSAECSCPLYVLTNNWTRGKQQANTPPPQSTTPGLQPVSIHQMAPPERTSDCSSLLMQADCLETRITSSPMLASSA